MVWFSICLEICNEVDKVVDFIFVQRVLVVIVNEEWEEREMLARGKKPPIF